MLQQIYACIECGERWDSGEIDRTRRCPNCGGKCEFQEIREIEEDETEIKEDDELKGGA